MDGHSGLSLKGSAIHQPLDLLVFYGVGTSAAGRGMIRFIILKVYYR